MEKQKCNTCGESKPLTLEYWHKAQNNTGFHVRCKPCRTQQQREYRQEIKLGKRDISYEEFKKRNAEYSRHPEVKLRAAAVRYGVTVKEITDIFNGVCQICEKQLKWESQERKELPCIDHCHKTGTVRGILCHNCNLGIGNLQDDPVIVAKALEYLRHDTSEL